ncbi:MAG TPA: hypothetical protein VNK96_05840 [Fimbriimonadales bacterium]|nr:hypothetical protein [Fimbriimonadales bacterium]
MSAIVHPGSLIKPRRKIRVRNRKRIALWNLALYVAGIAFGSAILTLFLRFGCVFAIEYAQMSAKHAEQRLESAQKEAVILRRELDAATNVAAVREWAEMNGFRLPLNMESGVEKS